MTTIAEIMQAMIAYSDGNLHDIEHFLKVWGYAKTIGELEGLDTETQFNLEIAAITHDIACPLCREKYGCTDGRLQEKEGRLLVAEFLQRFDLQPGIADRVAYLVGHHHTFTDINGLDHQILLEADYLVNAAESNYSANNIRSFCQTVFRTKTGTDLLRSIYF